MRSFSFSRFRVTKCDPKTARDRRTLLITEPNGSVPPSPATAGPTERSPGPKSQVQVSGFSVQENSHSQCRLSKLSKEFIKQYFNPCFVLFVFRRKETLQSDICFSSFSGDILKKILIWKSHFQIGLKRGKTL